MFLHAMAGRHPGGHEFSVSTPSTDQLNQLPRRPLMRSAFSNPIQRSATTYENTISTIIQPQRPLSEHRPKSTPLEHTVRFQEPELDTMSEDDVRSVAGSESSKTTNSGKRLRRRSPRTSTAYNLGIPAPTATQKQKLLQVRPELLLQLQRLSANSRPVPAIDVRPSSRVVPRLSKKFPRMFRGKGVLGPNDVLIVRNEWDAPAGGGHDSDDEERRTIAVICEMRKGENICPAVAEIALDDGSVWTVTPYKSGVGFEFVCTDSTGFRTTARWARRALPKLHGELSGTGPTDYRYIFSLIDPNSSQRQHRVLASITRTTLEIEDSYTPLPGSTSKTPLVSSTAVTGESIPLALDDEDSRTVVDEKTRTLIQVTGIFIALRQGWCPYFKYDDSIGSASTHGRARSLSLTPESNRGGACCNGSASPDSNHTTFGSIGRPKSCLSPVVGRVGSLTGSPTGHRTVSAGSTFMKKAAARKGTNLAGLADGEDSFDSQNRTTPEPASSNSVETRSTPTSISGPDSLTKPRGFSTISSLSESKNGQLKDRSSWCSSGIDTGNYITVSGTPKTKTSFWKSVGDRFWGKKRKKDG